MTERINTKKLRGWPPGGCSTHTYRRSEMSRSTQNPTATTRRAFVASLPLAAATMAPAAATALTGLAPQAADLDYSAALARAEQMIETLRSSVVCDGWHGHGLDEELAARMLAYFRQLAAGGPEDDDEFDAVLDFVDGHGQSLDWIFRGDAGGMICGSAARSPRAAMTETAEPDPIYAAIERHRAAEQEFSDRCLEVDDIVWYRQQVEAGRAAELRYVPETPEADAEYDRLNSIVNRAANDLTKMKPTTMRGAIALLRYVDADDDWTGDLNLSSFADALEAIERGAQS
jgi:hypothetical protein